MSFDVVAIGYFILAWFVGALILTFVVQAISGDEDTTFVFASMWPMIVIVLVVIGPFILVYKAGELVYHLRTKP